MKILISPFAQKLRNGKDNPKNFPYWPELVAKLLDAGFDVVQIGSLKDTPIKYENVQPHDHVGTFSFEQNLKLKEVANLIKECDVWISVDSFLQHLCAYHKLKRGIVIFSKSDPNIFGYTRNINILKNRSYLRKHQMWLWEQEEYDKDAFVSAQEVFDTVHKVLEA